MRRFVVIVIFILVASVVKGQTPTFTFQCVCDYLTAADSTCDICNTTTQSRFFKGLLIYKNGVAHKWIEQPYTIIQNFDALTFRELIPGAEQIRIELRGTAFDSIAQFRDSVLCPCSGTSTGTTLIAGPGVNIWNDTIAAIPQQIDTFDLVSGTADTIRISLTRDSVPYHYVILPPDSDNQYIDTLQLTGTTLEISLSGDGQPLKTVDLSSLVADGDETIVTAGTGISVTGIGTAGNPYVITNTGDLSNTNELQNLFDTIAVAGQQSIVPNSQHTKLTLVEGTGVTITTDSTAREITIEADTSLLATVNDIDVITLADSAELKAYTGIARGVVLRQQGREGLFTRTTTSRAHDGYMVFEDAAGRKWVRITEDDVLNVKWFGAIGNGVADDYYAIQRAIDYTIYEDTTIKKVFIPSGNYLVSRTIHMGYGSAYSSVSLVGDGTPTFRGEQQYNGATITVNFSNAPALNIQGARNSTVDNITFIGLNEITGYLTDTSASNISNWIYSGLDTIGDNRYTPYAAITVDAYAGSAPTPAYPNVLFPSYTGISTQYSKLSSSQVKIRNVHIYKFTAGIVIKPNADNNGDFVQIEKAIIERVAYGISIGNSQARNTRISDSYIDAHTCITNSKHGAQIGRISVIENVHFGGYQWFDLGAPAYLEGLEINDCYGESFQWIGSIGVGTVGAFPAITFNGCKFQASAIINRLLTPTANLTGDAVYNFNHCSFQGNRLYVFENDQAALINFNQCNFGSYPGLGEPGDTVQTYHTQYFRGFDFIAATNPTIVHVNQCRFHEISNTAGGGLYPAMKGDNTALSTDINYGNFWAKSNLDGSDVQFADLGFISKTNTLTAFTGGVSMTDRAFQGTSSSNFQQGIGTGDLLVFEYNNNTMPVVVTSVSGLVIQGQIMAGYAYDSGGAYAYMLQDTNISTGYVRHFSSRKLLNKKTVFGDFVSGSRIVTNVSYLFDNSDAADELTAYTPLLNADGYLNAIPSPVTVATYIDSIISSTSFRTSANATKTGRYEIRNCFLGTNNPNDLAIPVQEIVFGKGYGIKSEAAYNYDSTNNRINLNTTTSTRQLNLVARSTETSANAGILIDNGATTNADNHRIEFKSIVDGGYTQRANIYLDAFSNGGASPKGQALIFALTTDGQSSLGNTSLYENQLLVNNTGTFNIANNTGRLRFQASSSGIYNTDNNWLLGGSAYTTNDSAVRLKLAGDNSDTSTTEYGLRVFNGFNQPYFSARNDGNIILGGRTVASRFLFLERTGAGGNYTSWRAGDQASNSEYIWPVDTAAVGDVMTYINTDGSTAWSAPADGSPTNELQTIDNTSTDTTHTVTLSNSGGSFQVKEGANIALSTTGTGLNGVLTISSTGTDTSGHNIDFYISNDSLFILDGAGPLFVDLAPYLDNTDTSGYNLDFYISGDTLYIEDGDGQLFVPLSPYVNVWTDLSFSGASSPVTLHSSTGTDVTVTAGTGISLSATGTDIVITNTVTNTDAQNLTIEGSGPTYDIAISGGTDVTIQGGGIVTLSESPANTLIVTATEVDGSVTNEAWTIDADDADTELITNQTVKFEGAGTVTTDYDPGTNTLLITGTSAAGLNGIYGDGTATSGNDTLPPGGTTVTIPGQWQPLQFNANTAGGEVWSALVVNAATCSDDRFTKALVLKSPSDSLEVYNYDCGAIIKETGGILTLETDRELWLIGDSINATTIPTRTVLPFLVGQSAGGWLQKIEGTTTGQVPVWDEPNGWWELGSAGGSGTVTGSGAAGQMAYWDGTTSIAGENNHWWDATNDRLGVGTNGGAVSSRVDVTTNSLGTSQTTTSGLAVVNTTAAAAGAQQISPAIRWSGAGWKTNATAASQAVEFRSYVTPVQGTTAPTGYLGFGSAINGSWTNDQFNINSGGEVGIGTTTFTGAGAFARLNVTGSSATVAPYLINAFTASSSGGTVYAQISNTQTASTTFLSLGEAADINAIKAGLRRYGSTHATLPNQLDLVNVGSAAVTLSTNLTVRMTVAADGTVHATNKLAAGFSSTTGIHSTLQTAGSFAGARLETVAAPTFDATKHTVIYTASTNVSWTLPSAASCACDGRVYILHHAGTAGTITLSQTITKGNAGNFNTLTAGQWAYITYGAASIRGYKITSL